MKRMLIALLALLLAAGAALAADNGLYAADIAVGDDAFGFTNAIAVVSDAGVTLRVTATTGGGETLYADGVACAPAVNARGEDTYTLPVVALDEPVTITWEDADGAAHGFTLVVASEGLRPLGGATPAPAADGPGAEALGDGRYEVADFSFSGGTGKVRITCADIVVSGGAATATLVFSSPHYVYVKADGVEYPGVSDGESSTFEVPVRLNAETVVRAMTTAMSQPHEIEYALRVVPGDRLED